MTLARARGRWLRPAAIAAALAAAFTIALFVVRLPPAVVLRLLGIRSLVDLDGGVAIRYRLAPGTHTSQLRGRDDLEIVGDEVTVIYHGRSADEIDDLVRKLSQGTVRFQAVDSNSAFMRDLFARVDGGARSTPDPRAIGLGIKAEVDGWNPESGGHETDYYLRAADRAALETYLAELAAEGVRPGDDREIGFEYMDRVDPDAKPAGPFWRTYYLDRRVALDGTHIVNAVLSYDPQTNQPLVLVDFDREGAEAFADLTAATVGKKVATVLADRVVSAPIINQVIRGGRASITMGGSNIANQEREATALIEKLQVGPLPPGEVVDARYRPPTVTAVTMWLARALCGLVAGALAFMVIAVLARRSDAAPRISGAATRRPPLGRLAVTLATVGVVYLTTRVRLPGIRVAALEIQGLDPDAAQLSTFALGLMPLVTAFVLVELAALAVPAWRALRVTPDGRRRLGRAVAGLALILAAVQAWSMVGYLQGSSWSSASPVYGTHFMGEGISLVDPGRWSAIVMTLSMVAATAWLAIIIAYAGEHGLGNGYSVVIGAGVVLTTIAHVKQVSAPYQDPLGVGTWILAAITAIAIGAMIGWLVTRRYATSQVDERAPGAAIATPLAGLLPIMWLTALAAVTMLLASLDILVPAPWIEWNYVGSTGQRIALVVVGIALTLGLGWVMSRPGPQSAALARMTGAAVPPSTRAWWWAAAASVTLVLVSYAVVYAAVDHLGVLLDVIGFATLTVIGMDLVAEWRARRRADLVAVWPIQQTAMAEVALRVLGRAGITAHLRGRHHRALLVFFGPFVPIEVMVPADRSGEASALLRDLFDPAARGVATAW